MNEQNRHLLGSDEGSVVSPPPTADQTKSPDELGGVHIQGHIKIFDPETNQVFVEARA